MNSDPLELRICNQKGRGRLREGGERVERQGEREGGRREFCGFDASLFH